MSVEKRKRRAIENIYRNKSLPLVGFIMDKQTTGFVEPWVY
jgi:hypothetical protein